tara:strand:- start:133 stop:930 length:798 start_codon:yes stop_codon:yes gene_type:complete
MQEIDLYYKDLNIGRTLTCLLHSFKTETACILTNPSPPFKFDQHISQYDFTFLGIEDSNPQQAWDRLCFLLSMSGLLLFPNNISNARMSEKIVEIVTNNNQKINIKCDNINVFDNDETGWYYVYDYFDWKSGSSHDLDCIDDSDDSFIKKIIFYSSERDRVSNSVKDLVGVSYMREDELESLESSPTYSRLKMLRMMKDAGIRGRVTGYNSKGKGTYTTPIIEFNKRITKPDFKPTISLHEVYNMPTEQGYTWKLLEKIIQNISI